MHFISNRKLQPHRERSRPPSWGWRKGRGRFKFLLQKKQRGWRKNGEEIKGISASLKDDLLVFRFCDNWNMRILIGNLWLGKIYRYLVEKYQRGAMKLNISYCFAFRNNMWSMDKCLKLFSFLFKEIIRYV